MNNELERMKSQGELEGLSEADIGVLENTFFEDGRYESARIKYKVTELKNIISSYSKNNELKIKGISRMREPELLSMLLKFNLDLD